MGARVWWWWWGGEGDAAEVGAGGRWRALAGAGCRRAGHLVVGEAGDSIGNARDQQRLRPARPRKPCGASCAPACQAPSSRVRGGARGRLTRHSPDSPS